MRVITVATVSYLYQAVTMLDQYKKIHPATSQTIIVADYHKCNLIKLKGLVRDDIDLIAPEDLGYDKVGLIRTYYNPLEFCSALKIIGMIHFIEAGADCLFLDPDTFVLQDIESRLFQLAGDILLSPHTFQPYPSDGKSPDDLEISMSGFINGGVMFGRAHATSLAPLLWLKSKIATQWFVAPLKGLYADQIWLSALPYYFNKNVTLINDLGINVAYWNLHERSLYLEGMTQTLRLTTGEPVRLLHFSGYDVEKPLTLTRNSTREFDWNTNDAIQRILSDYAVLLKKNMKLFDQTTPDMTFSKRGLEDRMNLAGNQYAKIVSTQGYPSPDSYCLKILRAVRRFLQKHIVK